MLRTYLGAFKLLPDKIDKHTKSVKNWESNTKSQWAPNWSNHSNCIIYKVFFVEYLFRCDWEVNRYLYVSYWQRYEWLKVIHNTVRIWMFFFAFYVFIKIVSKISQKFHLRSTKIDLGIDDRNIRHSFEGWRKLYYFYFILKNSE